MISSVDSSTRPGCSGNPSIRSPSIWAAARPISASGCRTVVGGGGTQREIGRAAKATEGKSCGPRRGERLPRGGGRRGYSARDRQVGEAEDGDILRHPQPPLPSRLVQAERLL